MKELDLGENVRLLGAVPFTGMERFYATGDVFLFSSLRETSGTVLLEAMAHELPVVSLDQHGAKDIVSQESGIKVPINDARQVVMDLATALQRLATDHGLRQRMGIAARQRVAEVYSWEHKGDLLRNLYSSCARTAS
jgi:glycosyltransferase involved in cell wall biosynthesis